jgi:hypothetical protein
MPQFERLLAPRHQKPASPEAREQLNFSCPGGELYLPGR